jgi:hypothetical protein
VGRYVAAHRDAVLEFRLERLLARSRGRVEDIGLPVFVNDREGLVDVPLGKLDLTLKVDAERCFAF